MTWMDFVFVFVVSAVSHLILVCVVRVCACVCAGDSPVTSVLWTVMRSVSHRASITDLTVI